MKFCPLFSSSSGNSVYIGSGDEGILIDVGRTAKQVREMLAAIGVSDDSIKAIFITHEHNDHIKGLSVFAAKKKLTPVDGISFLLLQRGSELLEKGCSGPLVLRSACEAVIPAPAEPHRSASAQTRRSENPSAAVYP